jgi:membrane protease YdiL (CAAX protease family)
VPLTIAILSIVLSYTWLIGPRFGSGLVGIPTAVILALGVVSGLRTREWGLAPRALLPGLRATTLFTLPLVTILLAAGALLGTWREPEEVVATFGGLFVWGAAQQWVLQAVVMRELQRASSRTTGAIVAALLFGALHLPNPFLTIATLVGGFGWCAIYDRYPNILPLALSHAFGTLTLLYAFGEQISLRVGYSYLLAGA